MRYTQGEKLEIIRLVEGSDLPVKTTLEQLQSQPRLVLSLVPGLCRSRCRRPCSEAFIAAPVLEPDTG